jgi:hypothetical protein
MAAVTAVQRAFPEIPLSGDREARDQPAGVLVLLALRALARIRSAQRSDLFKLVLAGGAVEFIKSHTEKL